MIDWLRRRGSALLLGIALIGPTSASGVPEQPEAALTPGDFAHGRSIELMRQGALQAVLLDRLVHAGSVEAGLADLRVFNSAGESVPHAVRSLDASNAASRQRVTLPLFRLESPPAKRPQTLDSGPGLYSIDAEISASGAIVKVRPIAQPKPSRGDGPPSASDAEAPDDPASPPSGYLLDASQLRGRVVALELELEPGTIDFVTRVRVEGSDDLAHFDRLTKRAVIARLVQAGHRIERSRIELPATSNDYIRLDWEPNQQPLRISRVRVELERLPRPPPRHYAEIAGLPIEGEPGAHLFYLGGRLPVDLIELSLPQRNSLAEIELYSSDSQAGPWRHRYRGLVYSLDAPDVSGEVMRSSPIVWPVRRDRYFKLVVSPKGGGLGAGTPVLKVGWRPEQLLFIARGQAPFTLAYGRAGAPGTRFAATDLLATTRTRPSELQTTTAHLGPSMRLGSDELLSPPKEKLPLRTLALWALLLVVVAIVAALSLHLLREMKETTRDQGAGDDPPRP